ncbi:hypothetical protein ASD14_04480 [Lysobacter sp. Root494]|nr:hypothetical protein ASD14_04480 [Lysobacter sp. Root494]
MLILATNRVSASLDAFSGWLAAGFAAALALFIANLDTVSKFVLLGNIKCASVLFLASALLAIADKLLAAFIAAGTTAATEGAALGKEIAASGVELDVPAFFSQVERALFWPLSAFARRSFANAETGDFGGPGRMYTKVAQVQVLIVIAQAGLSLAAAIVIVCGLAV